MKQSEHRTQEACADFLAWTLPPECWWSAIDHANAKDKRTGTIRKRRGVKAGIPDFLLVWQGQLYGFELKAPKGRLSAAQRACHPAMQRAGAKIFLIWDSFDLEKHLRTIGVPLRGGHLPLDFVREAA